MRLAMRAVGLVLVLMTAGCGDKTIILPGAPTPTSSGTPSTTTPAPAPQPVAGADVIEYRVTGSASTTRIRYGSSADGVTQVVTTLPFSQTFRSTAPSVFVSLDVTPVTWNFFDFYPFLSVEIVVNGTLFRGATSDNLQNTVSVSGTWRH